MHPDRPLKINFVIHRPILSGGSLIVAMHAKWLQDQGHTVCVTGLGDSQPTLFQQLRSLKRNGRLEFVRKANTQHFDNVNIPVNLVLNKTSIDAHNVPDADIVIATWWSTSHWIAAMPDSKGAKAYFIQGYEATFPAVDKQKVIDSYRLPIQKITISKWLAEKLAANHGISDCLLAPNGIDTQLFSRKSHDKPLRPTIGFTYTNATVKRVDRVIDACIALRSRFPDLHVIGFGAETPNKLLPVPDWFDISVNPARHLIPEIYSACSAWLFASENDGFGMAVLEAMACGAPMVSSSVGVAPELINAQNGVLLPDASVDALVHGAAKILSLPKEDWRILSQNAAAAAGEYSLERAGETFEKAVLKIAATHRQ